MGASAFVDSNYFRNCPKPMMSSMQGSDAQGDGTFSGETGGIIKAYNNIMTDAKSYITYQQNNTSFDAYEAANAKESVPGNVRTLSGGTGYNNFDTASGMYAYKADAPADVPAAVTAGAGRVQGGDFKWKFDNSADDASYAVNPALKQALVSYKSGIVAIGSGAYIGSTEPVVTTTASVTVTTTATHTTESTAAETTASSSACEPDILLAGDVDCSGIVDVSDAVLLARFIAEDPVRIASAGMQNADCDEVSGIGTGDVIRILRIINKQI